MGVVWCTKAKPSKGETRHQVAIHEVLQVLLLFERLGVCPSTDREVRHDAKIIRACGPLRCGRAEPMHRPECVALPSPAQPRDLASLSRLHIVAWHILPSPVASSRGWVDGGSAESRGWQLRVTTCPLARSSICRSAKPRVPTATTGDPCCRSTPRAPSKTNEPNAARRCDMDNRTIHFGEISQDFGVLHTSPVDRTSIVSRLDGGRRRSIHERDSKSNWGYGRHRFPHRRG